MSECVGAIIIQQGSVLLGKRSANRKFYPNVWDVFGGHVESGESNRQALERELSEELGIVVADAHYIETLRIQSLEGDHMECRLFAVTHWTGRTGVCSYHRGCRPVRKKNQCGKVMRAAQHRRCPTKRCSRQSAREGNSNSQ
jgi:mutator protein MutT